jgi:hypothetical protein
MGSSVRVIERHYDAPLDGAGADIAARLDAYDSNAGEGQQEPALQEVGTWVRVPSGQAAEVIGYRKLWGR